MAARHRDWWTPKLLAALRETVRDAYSADRTAAKRAGLVRLFRQLAEGPPEVAVRMASDPALCRWTAGTREALTAGDQPRFHAMLSLASRLHLGVALASGADVDLPVALGSGGRARIPADGRVLQGPAARTLMVRVEGGRLLTHARKRREVHGLEVADGDAEGGRLPGLRPLSGGAAHEALDGFDGGLAALAETWPELYEEARALAPVLVPVAARPDVSESASLPSVRGCFWLTAPHTPLVVAETFAHETSHLKFYLLEDGAPLIAPGPDPPRLRVPWRADLRPLRMSMLGLHAWVRAIVWLRRMEDGPWSTKAAERRAVLQPATGHVFAALAPELDDLTEHGRAVFEGLRAAWSGDESAALV